MCAFHMQADVLIPKVTRSQWSIVEIERDGKIILMNQEEGLCKIDVRLPRGDATMAQNIKDMC